MSERSEQHREESRFYAKELHKALYLNGGILKEHACETRFRPPKHN